LFIPERARARGNDDRCGTPRRACSAPPSPGPPLIASAFFSDTFCFNSTLPGATIVTARRGTTDGRSATVIVARAHRRRREIIVKFSPVGMFNSVQANDVSVSVRGARVDHPCRPARRRSARLLPACF